MYSSPNIDFFISVNQFSKKQIYAWESKLLKIYKKKSNNIISTISNDNLFKIFEFDFKIKYSYVIFEYQLRIETTYILIMYFTKSLQILVLYSWNNWNFSNFLIALYAYPKLKISKIFNKELCFIKIRNKKVFLGSPGDTLYKSCTRI